MTNPKSQYYQIWWPFGFCALLTLMRHCFPSSSSEPAYYLFFPMCFFGVALIQLTLLRRIRVLESAIRANQREGESTTGA